MDIQVVAQTGTGRTELAAFDDALVKMGCVGCNLIRLSSVIPKEGQIVETDRYNDPTHKVGNKVYVVMAEMRSSKPGDCVAAGIGWYQFADYEKGGIFVEHELKANSRDEAKNRLETLIKQTIEDMCKYRKVVFEPKRLGMRYEIATVDKQPVCVATLAIYQSKDWNS